jgi:hypothetical protein
MQLLEEFARAFLWNDSLIQNDGMMVVGGEVVEAGTDEFNRRVDRLQQACHNLPADLFEEIREEDAVIYKDL